jgi:hypothetical protein
MKRACSLLIVSMMVMVCFGQHANSTFVASISNSDRMEMVKNSIDIPAWHEKSFWPLYEKYMTKFEEASSLSYRSLDDLARTDSKNTEQEAFDNARKMLDNRYAELAVRKEYFISIGNSFNGIIALQFLQTESLLDMMESSRIYESTSWKKYRLHPTAVESDQLNYAKHNTIAKAVALTPEKAQAFYEVYSRYEAECNDLLGDNYDLYSLYAGEPADFTPGLSKRLGYDLVSVMQRELKLKDKYFMAMNEAVGPVLASRFLVWEDYYSLISKMHAWSEGLD